MNIDKEKVGLHVLRFGLAAVFLWFGFSQLMDSAAWIGWVPEWTSLFGITPNLIVLVNGTFEVIAGALLVAGFFVRPVALLLALHLVLITIEIGFNETGVRDFGLTMATFALALLWSPEDRA